MKEYDVSLGQLAQWACVAEVTAPKPGNVHLGASFADASWRDFVVSAIVIRPILDGANQLGVGATVFKSVKATRAAVGTNTNLGIVLLLAPLCAVALTEDLESGVKRVLRSLTNDDTRLVYEAIRIADPGGLGVVEHEDIDTVPSASLIEAMRLAADHDAIARQFVNDFHDVRQIAVKNFTASNEPLDQAVVRAHLGQMAEEPDSLIQRKCGSQIALESQRRARAVLDARWPYSIAGKKSFDRLDAWLRADGNHRNPGTSADLVTASLFVAMRWGLVRPPFRWAKPTAGFAG